MLDYGRAQQELQSVGTLEPEAIIQHLVGVADRWGGKRAQDDDMTFVVIKVKGSGVTEGSSSDKFIAETTR